MTFAVLIHLPFSCLANGSPTWCPRGCRYHLLLARRALKDAVDNQAPCHVASARGEVRRVDQSFIHVTSMSTAVALSESDIFATAVVILNLRLG